MNKPYTAASLALFILLTALLAGCTLPEKGYHAMKIAKVRAEAIPLTSLTSAIQIRTARANNRVLAPETEVLVLARIPSEAVRTGAYSSRISPDERQLLEGALQQGLLTKGYGTGTRLNVIPVQEEMAFPFGRVTMDQLKALIKPPYLLIMTVTRFTMNDEEYKWQGFVWDETYRRPIGTRISLNLSLELIDAATSKTLCLSTASAEALLREKATRFAVMEVAVRRLMDELPQAVERQQAVN